MTPTVLYQKQTSSGVFSQDPRVGELQTQRFDPDQRSDKFIQAALTIEGKLGNFDITYAGAYLDRKTYQINDYTDYAEAYDALYASSAGSPAISILKTAPVTTSTRASTSSAPIISAKQARNCASHRRRTSVSASSPGCSISGRATRSIRTTKSPGSPTPCQSMVCPELCG